MGEEAVFLGIVDNEVAGEVPVVLLAIHLHLWQGKPDLQAIGNAFVIGAEDHRVFALHAEAQFLVVLANLCRLLAYRGFDDLITLPLFRAEHLRPQTQRFVFEIERKGAVFKQRPAA